MKISVNRRHTPSITSKEDPERYNSHVDRRKQLLVETTSAWRKN
jgi:hypothetical protein